VNGPVSQSLTLKLRGSGLLFFMFVRPQPYTCLGIEWVTNYKRYGCGYRYCTGICVCPGSPGVFLRVPVVYRYRVKHALRFVNFDGGSKECGVPVLRPLGPPLCLP
jgi:hypothetical protein